MKKIAKFLSIASLLITTPIIIICALIILPRLGSSTHNFSSKDSVGNLEEIKLGGQKQWVLMTGAHTEKPLILFLHGGPGSPLMPYAVEYINGTMHANVISVSWDMAGSGKSYSENFNKDRINLRQYIDDAHELTSYLKKRFNKEKIYLVGYDWGALLGAYLVKENPNDYFAFINVAPVVDVEKVTKLQDEFIESKLKDNALKAFRESKEELREKYLYELGAVFKNSKNNFPQIIAAYRATEYTIWEFFNIPKGIELLTKNMKYNVGTGKPINDVLEFKVPVYFFVSKSDFVTPYTTIEEYYNKITAPKKEILLFENSAHYPFLEEEDKFVTELLKIVK